MRCLLISSMIAIAAVGWCEDSKSKEQPLPPAAKSTIDGLAKTIEKMTADYTKSVNAERQKTITALDKILKDETKKGNLDTAVAVKAKIEELSASIAKSDNTDMLGSPKAEKTDKSDKLGIVGAWHVTRDDGHDATWTFIDDHTVVATEVSGRRFTGMWTPGDDGNTKIVWAGNPANWELFHPPFNGDAMTGDGWNVGKNAVHAKRLNFSPIVGQWSVAYNNNTVREYIVDAAGVLTFGGVSTPIQFTPDGSGYVVRFVDAKLERWTLKSGHLNVEHWNPSSGYPGTSPQFQGMGTKK